MIALINIPADILTDAYDAAIEAWNAGHTLAGACINIANTYAQRGYDRAQMLTFLTAECAVMRRLTKLEEEYA